MNAVNIPVPVSLCTSGKATLSNSIHKVCLSSLLLDLTKLFSKLVYQFMRPLATWRFPFSCILANTWNFKTLLTWIWNAILLQFTMTSLSESVGIFLWISCWYSLSTFLCGVLSTLWLLIFHYFGVLLCLSVFKKTVSVIDIHTNRKFFKSWPYNAVLTRSSQFFFYFMLQMTFKVILTQNSVRKNVVYPWGSHW